MKRVGQFHQTFADEKKEIPCDEKAEATSRDLENPREHLPLCQRLPREFLQADRTQDAVFVLGDAFAAEVVPAYRALGGGFARGMIEAMLLGQGHFRVESVNQGVSEF